MSGDSGNSDGRAECKIQPPYFGMIRIVLAGESAGLPGKYFHNKTRSVYNLPYQTKTVFTI